MVSESITTFFCETNLDLLTSLAIAFALAIDAFAVSVASGISLINVSKRQTFRLSFHFGLFQSLMTFLGWFGGVSVKPLIEDFDHWLAFCLLLFVGTKMIIDAIKKNEEETFTKDPTKGLTMVILSIATSIDALAVGLSFSMLKMSVTLPIILIGIVATLMTIFGLFIGKTIGQTKTVGKYAQILGALVLYGIGLKVLFEHGAL